jgi:hypothetical protein
MSEEKEKKENETQAMTKKAKAAEEKDLYTRNFIRRLESMIQEFMEEFQVDNNLTGTDRRRLTGSGVRNNGFIDKAFDIAHDNPTFMPPHFDVTLLNWNMNELEDFRQLMFVLQQFTQLASNAFLLQADLCYRDALRIYASLREQARNRVPGADPLFRALQTFFSRRRRDPNEEPTESELERDISRLIHGKADGEIVIKNESPHTTGGIHEVIDSVHSGRSAFKGTVEGSGRE